MVEKIAADVSKKLNLTIISRDFEGMVGMEAHLRNLYSLLCLECNEVKMIGVWGPAGIGKTTIARALFNNLSSDFRLTCFMGNLKGSYNKRIIGDDDYYSKLCVRNVRNGLKILADKSLVYVSTDGKIVRHYLLQQFGNLEVVKQSNEPGKRQFLVEAQDILNVLANGTGTESVIGISFDMSKTKELFISRTAFERMHNLQFLRVYMGHSSDNVSLCRLEGMHGLPTSSRRHGVSTSSEVITLEFIPRNKSSSNTSV